MKTQKEKADLWTKVCLWAYIVIFVLAMGGVIYMAAIGLPHKTIYAVFGSCLFVCAGIAVFQTNVLEPIRKS